jgi:hypothetical protein
VHVAGVPQNLAGQTQTAPAFTAPPVAFVLQVLQLAAALPLVHVAQFTWQELHTEGEEESLYQNNALQEQVAPPTAPPVAFARQVMHLAASFPTVQVGHDAWQATHASAVPAYAPEQAHVPGLVPPVRVAPVLQSVQLLVVFAVAHLAQVLLHEAHVAASVFG